MAQPGQKPILVTFTFDQLMMRVLDELGIEQSEIRDIVRTVEWGGQFELGKPVPGKLSNTYLTFAMFHGCKGEEETRVPGEQRVYATPMWQGLPFTRLTFVPGWDKPRHEVMGQDAFIEEVAAEFSLQLDISDDDERACPKCGEDVGEEADFCASCGEKLPEEPEEPDEPSDAPKVDPDATIVPPPS